MSNRLIEVHLPDGSERNLIFVRSELDDAGLSAAEFRVYCHIARREGKKGDCYATVASMAKVCRLNEDTVWSALSSLEKKRLINRINRPGRTSLVSLTQKSEWNTNPPEKEGYPLDSGEYPPEKEGCKGSTREGTPNISSKKKVDPSKLPEYERIYDAYPRKAARPVALLAIQKAALGNPGVDLLAAVCVYAQYCSDESVEPRFIPMPATWFNQERWKDDLISQKPRGSTNEQLNRDLELVRNSPAFPGGNRYFEQHTKAEYDAYAAARIRIKNADPTFNFQSLK